MQCYNKDEPWEHYAKWNMPDTKGWILYDLLILYNEGYQGWRGGGRKESYFLMGMKFLSEMMMKL